MSEAWRPVAGYEDAYLVSSSGSVKSVRRTNSYGRTVRGRLLKPQLWKSGHLKVGLSKGGKQTHKYVHVLVLEAFDKPRPEGLLVRHLNGDPIDNRVTNLRWGTASENQQDALLHGVNYQRNKTHCIRGHLYTGDNLIQWWLKRGERKCWACTTAGKKARRLGIKLTQELADEYYERVKVA